MIYVIAKKACFHENVYRSEGDVFPFYGSEAELPKHMKIVQQDEVQVETEEQKAERELQRKIQDAKDLAIQDARNREGSGQANPAVNTPDATEAPSGDGTQKVVEPTLTPEQAHVAKITSVVASIDHTNDLHWNKTGDVCLNFLKEAVGEYVKRTEVEALFPNLKREVPEG